MQNPNSIRNYIDIGTYTGDMILQFCLNNLYVDDDDRVKPVFSEFLFSQIKDNCADIAMCGSTEGDGEKRKPQCLSNEKMILSGEGALRLLLVRKYIRFYKQCGEMGCADHAGLSYSVP